MRTPEAKPDGNKEQTLQQQRRQLAAWLAAYALDQALREDTAAPPADVPPKPAGAEPVVPGQIRLLPPAASPLPDERPVFVLVAPGAAPDRFTIIPFSRFDLPATPQEWMTGLAQPALQVLCLWNARDIPAKILSHAWLAGNMSAPALAAALTALQQPLPDTSRRGPPLLHPLDPRHVYLQEETILLDTLAAARDHTENPTNTIRYEIPEPRIEFLRAAEPPPPQNDDQ